jgi:S-adenosylmethionine decarboxylase
MQPLAHHTLLEVHGCDASLLRHADELKPRLLEAIRLGGGTVVTELFHNFAPHGVSGVVIITESHVAIHTWPEHQYAAIDIFSCGESLNHELIGRELCRALKAKGYSSRLVERGCGIRSESNRE